MDRIRWVGTICLLGTILLILAVGIAALAVLVGVGMVVEPCSVETGLVMLVFLAALAACCWAMGAWLRRTAETGRRLGRLARLLRR